MIKIYQDRKQEFHLVYFNIATILMGINIHAFSAIHLNMFYENNPCSFPVCYYLLFRMQ